MIIETGYEALIEMVWRPVTIKQVNAKFGVRYQVTGVIGNWKSPESAMNFFKLHVLENPNSGYYSVRRIKMS